jgi:hypothetical protein
VGINTFNKLNASVSVTILCCQFVIVATWLVQIRGKQTVVARWVNIVDVLTVVWHNAVELMLVVVVTVQSDEEKLLRLVKQLSLMSY